MPQTYNLDPCTVSESLGLLDRLLLAEILPNGKITPIMSCSGSYQEKQFPKDLKITEASWSISQVSVFSLFHHDSVERFTFRSTSCQSPDTRNKKCKSSPGYNIRQSDFKCSQCLERDQILRRTSQVQQELNCCFFLL